ncbi:MAG: FtsW/RodA/SpoVE family cell cycle protein [Planctomycetes bacterium]|nr:FtsW/RodA/SpoVE family cell cycle protein [Planctomycetota bacterium]
MTSIAARELWLALLVGLLVLMGCVVQASIGSIDGIPHHRIFLQWIAVSAMAAVVVRLIPYGFVLRHAPLIYLGGLLLLILVQLVGEVRFNARRWIVIGGVSVQPSELMKFAFVIFWARVLRHERAAKGLRALVLPGLALALPVALIFRQPDLGTALLFVPTALAMLLAAGMPRGQMVKLCLVGVLMSALGYGLLEPYQKERILSTFQRERLTAAEKAREGYQLEQSIRSIAMGGVFGQGFAEGVQNRMKMLPFRHNDFIYAVVAEEFGFVGASFLIGVVLLLTVTILRVGFQVRDESGRLLCVGLGVLYASQSFVHIAVNLGIAPTTGMPLPFVSAGGTSLLTNVCALALVSSVARRPRRVVGGGSLREQLMRLEALLGRRKPRDEATARVAGVGADGRFRGPGVRTSDRVAPRPDHF